MVYTTTICLQVPGESRCQNSVDGHCYDTGVRDVMNLCARSIIRQTITAKTFTDFDILNVLTHNVRTLMKQERLIELENALKYISWDIIGLAEVRRQGKYTEERENDIFLHFGETNPRCWRYGS